MSTKKILSLLIVVSLVFVVANVAIAEEKSPLLEFAEKADVNWELAKGKTIHLITPSFYAMDYMGKKQAPLFEKLTGAKVIWEYFPPEEAKLKSRIDLTSGAGTIDIPYTPHPRVVEYMAPGWLESLDKYLNDPELTDLKWYNVADFLSVYLKAAQLNGKQYGFPTTYETSLLACRKDVFKDACLQYPQSFDDWYDACEKINNPPQLYAAALRGARGAAIISWTWTGFFRSFGGKFFKDYPDDLTPTVNSSEGIAGTQRYVDMFQFAPIASKGWGWPEKLNALQQGVVATEIIPSDFVYMMENPEQSKTAGMWEYSPVPYGPYGRYPYVQNFYFGVNAKSKNKIASWLLVEFLTCPLAVDQRESGERISSWNKVLSKDTITGKKGPWVKDWEMAIKTDLSIGDPNYLPLVSEYGEYADAIGIRISQAITGDLGVKAAMDKLQRDFEKIFAGQY